MNEIQADVAFSRWAVYFAPPVDHPLWRAGSEWLGRDARFGEPDAPPARERVAAPWRYGFHATLKAPCRLVEGASRHAWLADLQALAQRHAAFEMPPLHVAMLDDFLALRPIQPLDPNHRVRRLADACVLDLDRWRAPADEAERSRRMRQPLSARQRANLQWHGYPYVLEDWRLHMTLSDSLMAVDEGLVSSFRAQAQRHFAAAVRQPLRCDALCLFIEEVPAAPLRLLHRFPLADG